MEGKQQSIRGLALVALLSTLNYPSATVHAQGTAFTYQGRLNAGGNPASGLYDFSFALYNAAGGGKQQGAAVTTNAVGVTNGLFTVTLDFGSQFSGSALWLDISVRTNGAGSYTELSPRQALTPAPYALYAPNAGLAGAVGANAISASQLNTPAAPTNGEVLTFNGSGLAWTSPGSGGGWSLTGNAGTTSSDFLGTLDNQRLELRVNNLSALDLFPGANGSPSLTVGPFAGVRIGAQGANVLAGGYAGAYNTVYPDFATIAGGYNNLINASAPASVIAGGGGHVMNGNSGAIGGGFANSVSGYAGTVPGGANNTVSGDYGLAAGNGAQAANSGAFVWADNSGGTFASTANNQFNVRATGGVRFVTGGAGVTVDGSPIGSGGGGGGAGWSLTGNAGTLAGLNFLGTTDNEALELHVGGQRALRLEPNGNGPNVIGGASDNAVAAGYYGATIGGGVNNSVSNYYGTVPGGLDNVANGWASFAAGYGAQAEHTGAFVWADCTGTLFPSTTNNQFSVRASGGVRFVTGGAGVTVDGVPIGSGGGGGAGWSLTGNAGTSPSVDFLGTLDNEPLNFRVNGEQAFRLEPGNGYPNVVGGYGSSASGPAATVGGGVSNSAAYYGTVGGGWGNNAAGSSSYYAAISGGYSNTASASEAYVGGGSYNTASGAWTAVPGGEGNVASGSWAVVAGGEGNTASGNNSFAAGTFAQAAHTGAFVWADDSGSSFSSTASNQFNVRAQGGVRVVTGGAGMTIDGQPVATGSGGGVATNAWSLTGNAGTSPGVDFLGTTDPAGLELHVNSVRGLRLDYAGVVTAPYIYAGININSGHWSNQITANVVGATIAGGGNTATHGLHIDTEPNIVNGSFGTVGGGHDNTAGVEATVPGGYNNAATGDGSFAAGRNAQTANDGSFVWSDGSQATFTSSGANCFDVLASGGVFFNASGGVFFNNGAAGVHIASSQQGGASLDYGLKFGDAGSGEGIGSNRGYGINPDGLDFYTDYTCRMSISQSGNVGIGGSVDPAGPPLQVSGNCLEVFGGQAANNAGLILAYFGGDGGGSDVQIGSFNSGITNVGFWNPNLPGYMNIYCAAATCSSLTITGGSDIAEPFPVTGRPAEPGTVMVIDPANPGGLMPSRRAYDTRVAGIISGAGGIKPGLELQQEGVLEQGQKVALSGRVYVRADASLGEIEPGDLLTTSDVPGHAMKVTDHARAQGAILGKAMTGLKEGQGLVLVLVTLQ